MKTFLKKKTVLFILSLFAVALLFIGLSYYFLIQNYKNIEFNQNQRYMNTLLTNIDKSIQNFTKINNNYTVLTTLNDFLNSKNKSVLKQTFPNNKSTLAALDLNFILINNIEDEKYFSQYTNDLRLEENSDFDKFFIKKLSSFQSISTIIEFNNKIFFIIKQELKKQNKTKKIKGYVYYGKLIKNSDLKIFAPFFSHIKNINNKVVSKLDKPKKLNSFYFENIYVSSYITKDFLQNDIQFYDLNNKYFFSLTTSSNRTIIEDGEETIYIFTLLVVLFLVLIFLISFLYYNSLKSNNTLLELQVEKKNKQIETTLYELEKVNFKLYDIAHIDSLTKVRNRKNFFVHAENAFNKAVKNNFTICVIIFDIENFKDFNNQFGHEIGDKILQEFAECLKNNMDNSAVLGRLGGEEFAMILIDSSLQEANIKAQYLRKKVKNISLSTHEEPIHLNINFGISNNHGCKDIDKMLNRANINLGTLKNDMTKLRERV